MMERRVEPDVREGLRNTTHLICFFLSRPICPLLTVLLSQVGVCGTAAVTLVRFNSYLVPGTWYQA